MYEHIGNLWGDSSVILKQISQRSCLTELSHSCLKMNSMHILLNFQSVPEVFATVVSLKTIEFLPTSPLYRFSTGNFSKYSRNAGSKVVVVVVVLAIHSVNINWNDPFFSCEQVLVEYTSPQIDLIKWSTYTVQPKF